MGILASRTIAELGPDLVLAPEHYDPRRHVQAAATRCLGDLVEIAAESVDAASFARDARVLILDTTHAFEGFVLFRHEPTVAGEIGSAKRRLMPGDVIVSRLRPYLRQVAFVDEGLFRVGGAPNALVASTEFFVLRRRRDLDPACLVPYLLSPAVQAALCAGQEGGHHPRFGRELLQGLPVPPAVVDTSESVAREVRGLAASVRSAFEASRRLVGACDAAIRAGEQDPGRPA